MKNSKSIPSNKRNLDSDKSTSGDLILRRVLELTDVNLQDLLAALFDRVDDSLFAMAERAAVNSDQNLYFEAMRELRLQRGGVLTRYKGVLTVGFELMIDGGNSASLKSSRLALVRDSELEENVAIESMVARTRNRFGDELSLLSLRLDRLIITQVVDEGNNAISPEKICTAFMMATADVNIDVRMRLLLLKLFEKEVLSQIGNVYIKLNSFLADMGVLPNVQLAKKENKENANFEHQYEDEGESDEVFSTLQQLVRDKRKQENSETYDNKDVKNVIVIRRNTVVTSLSSLAQSSADLTVDEAGYINQMPDKVNLKHKLLEMFNTDTDPDSRYELSTTDTDTIDIVSMLFDMLNNDKSMALPMRALLNLLQIPVAKVGLLDKSLFSQEVHPARKLMDELIVSGLGWRPGEEADRDFYYKKIREVVELVLTEFSDDIHLFQQALADFMIFRDVETKRRAIGAQRLIERGKGQARAEAGNMFVKREIATRIDSITLPVKVRDTIKFYWSKLLFMIYLREGEEGENWLAAIKVVDELVWSVSAKITAPDKSRLTRLLPGLKRSLYNGLTRMEMSHFEMNRLYDELDKCHDLAANGQSRWGLTVKNTAGEHDSMEEIEDIRVLSNVSEGSWFDLNNEQGGYLYRLSVIIDPPGKYIFIDRSGRDVQTFSRAELAEKIVKNAVEEIDDRLFFDRALSVLKEKLN
ncbi:MAG: hypothetical protein ACI90U_001962 [Pseudomonadales bacterium]|jgi:hypothetical protein